MRQGCWTAGAKRSLPRTPIPLLQRAPAAQTSGDTFLENEDFYFLPSYKRGSKLTIGNEFVYTVRSTLLYWNEQPAGYKTLKITGEGIPEILTFTNNSGKFIATGLKPGVYEIKVNGANETAQFEINGDQKLVFIESIKLADPNSI